MRGGWPLRAAVVALAALALAVVGVLLERGPRLAGTNNEFDFQAPVSVPPGATACQGGETIPDDTAAVQVGAGAQDQPASMGVTVRGDDRVLARGATRWDGSARSLRIPIKPGIIAERPDATVCVRNTGDRPFALNGYQRAEPLAATIAGQPAGGRVRLGYLLAGEPSWIAVAPRIVERAGTARGRLLDTWPPYVAAFLMAAAAAGVLLAIRRDAG